MEQIKRNLINRDFSAYKAGAMAQYHAGIMIPSIRHTQTPEHEHDITTNDQDPRVQSKIVEDGSTSTSTFPYVRHFNMSDELYNEIE